MPAVSEREMVVRRVVLSSVPAAGTDQYLRRRPVPPLSPPLGKKGGPKTAIATAHTLIVIIWHVLAETTAYRDLGSDYFTSRIDHPEARKRRLIRELEALGHKVTSNPPPHSQAINRSPTSSAWVPGHRPLRPERAWSPQLRLSPPRGSHSIRQARPHVLRKSRRRLHQNLAQRPRSVIRDP